MSQPSKCTDPHLLSMKHATNTLSFIVLQLAQAVKHFDNIIVLTLISEHIIMGKLPQ